jgi:hypothetical protein
MFMLWLLGQCNLIIVMEFAAHGNGSLETLRFDKASNERSRRV